MFKRIAGWIMGCWLLFLAGASQAQTSSEKIVVYFSSDIVGAKNGQVLTRNLNIFFKRVGTQFDPIAIEHNKLPQSFQNQVLPMWILFRLARENKAPLVVYAEIVYPGTEKRPYLQLTAYMANDESLLLRQKKLLKDVIPSNNELNQFVLFFHNNLATAYKDYKSWKIQQGTKQSTTPISEPSKVEAGQKTLDDEDDEDDGEGGKDTKTDEKSPTDVAKMDASAGAGTFEAETVNVATNGQISLQEYYYPKELTLPSIQNRAQAQLQLDTTLRYKEHRARAQVVFRGDLADPDRNLVTLREGFVFTKKGPANLKMGKIIETWGTLSLINPANLLPLYDLRDPIDMEAWGRWMVRGGLLFQSVEISAYWMPVFEANWMPGIVFDPTTPLLRRWDVNFTGLMAQLPPNLVVTPIQTPKFGTDSFSYAAKISYSGAFDAALAYYHGNQRIPTFKTSFPDMGTIQINPVYETIDNFMLNFQAAAGSFRFSGEGVFYWTRDRNKKDPTVDDPYIEYALGVDWRSSEMGAGHFIHLFVEFYHVAVPGGKLADNLDKLFHHPLEMAAYTRVSYEWTNELSFTLDTAVSLQDSAGLTKPRFTFYPADGLSLQLGAIFIWGQKSTYFNMYKDNWRTELELIWKF